MLETKTLTRVGSEKEIEVDVRVIAATNRDLEDMAKTGAFRVDLLYRLNAVTLSLPPLRDRADDIVPLAEAFLIEANRANERTIAGFEAETLAMLRCYSWPGNVRELKNVIERAVVVAQGERLGPDDLPPRVRANRPPGPAALPAEAVGADFQERMRVHEVEILLSALAQAKGSQKEAARLLGMPLRTLVHKLHTHGIRKRFEST